MKHKVGDKVKIVGNVQSHGLKIGSVELITKVSKDQYFNGRWWFFEQDCELYADPTAAFTHPKDAPDGHKWQMLNGYEVEQVTVFETTVGDFETYYVWHGQVYKGQLIDAPRTHVMWVNVYGNRMGNEYISRAECDNNDARGRTGCIRVEYQEGQYDE